MFFTIVTPKLIAHAIAIIVENDVIAINDHVNFFDGSVLNIIVFI